MDTTRPFAPRSEPPDEEPYGDESDVADTDVSDVDVADTDASDTRGRHRLMVPEPAPLTEHGPARIISMANQNPKLKDYCFGNLTEDRITFSIGRDLELVPKQDGPPLNFFVYPYAEVDGKPLAADKIKRKYSYEDIAGPGK